MSFQPLNLGLSESLLGVAATNNDFINTSNYINKKVVKNAGQNNDPKKMILAIIVSAVIFITIVSIYSIIRNIINNYYTKKALTDPKVEIPPQEVEITLLANEYGLIASIVFAIVCIIIASIAIFLSWSYFKN